MKTIALELPEQLAAKLNRAARQRGTSESELARTAIVQFLESPPPTATLAERAGDLLGCLEGPGDLSCNPKYLEGLGQ